MRPEVPDLNKLEKQLSNARKYMDVGTSKNQSQNVNEGSYEKELPNLTAQYQNNVKSDGGSVDINTTDEGEYQEIVGNSNLPPHIKKIMSEQYIKNQPEEPELPKSLLNNGGGNKINETPTKQKDVTTNLKSNNLNKDEIKEVFKDVLGELMLESISENLIKKTLKKMVTEGKLKIKK